MLRLQDMRMKPKLIGLFLAVGLIPLALAAVWSSLLSGEALMEKSFVQLESVRSIKKAQIEAFFETRRKDIDLVVQQVVGMKRTETSKLRNVQELKKAAIESLFVTISTMLNEIATSIGNAAADSDEVARRLAEASDGIAEVNRSINEVSGGIGEVTRNMGETAFRFDEVTRNVGETSRGNAEITRNVSEVSGASGEIAARMEEVKASTEQINGLSLTVGERAGAMKEIAESLSGMLGCFRVETDTAA